MAIPERTVLPEYTVGDQQATLYLNDQLRRQNNYNGAIDTLRRMTHDARLAGPIALLPDITDSQGSLPVGTTLPVALDQKLDPRWVGMDIGCGYQLLETSLPSKRLYRKAKKGPYGTIKRRVVDDLVEMVDSALHQTLELSPVSYKFPLHTAHTERIQEQMQKELGTLGKGNHFITLYIPEPHDDKVLNDTLHLLIHTGSRSLGYHVQKWMTPLFAEDQDPAIFNKHYLNLFRAAEHFAKRNRNALASKITKTFSGLGASVRMIGDNDHNTIRRLDDRYIVQKGTQYVPPLTHAIIPGTAKDHAYLVRSTYGSSATYHTLNHGTGRSRTRHQAFQRFRRKQDLLREAFRNVSLNVNEKQMIEEVPVAYNPIQQVIASLEVTGLAQPVQRLLPVGVVVER